MTTLQKVIKYLAIAFAIFLTVAIIGGILSAAGILSAVFVEDAVAEETKTYAIGENIVNLNIRINAADLYIKEGEAFLVESNLKHLKVNEVGNTLTIEETKMFGGNYNNAVLTVFIPAGTEFYSTDLATGAGRLTVEDFSSQILDLELGAGDVSITSLSAGTSASIEGGAGRITISGGSLRNLELQMGVGQLNLTSALTGECELDLGVGESNITIIGNEEDYRMELEKGIGALSVNGKPVNDYGRGSKGANTLDINGGIGAINLYFAEPGAY